MKKLSSIRGIVLLLVAIFIATTLVLSLKAFNRSTVGQEPKVEKIVSRDMSKEEPFTFDDLKINSKKIKLHTKFTIAELNKTDDIDSKPNDEKKLITAEDWLHDLEFKIINKSDTPIISITVQLAFPETLPNGSEYTYSIRLGQWPNSPRKTGEPILIIKGDHTHIKFRKETLDDLKKFLSRGGYNLENLTKVNIGIRNIVFKDGRMWSQSDWYSPDPNVPGKYNMVNPQ
jgi:hypothetical protein